MADRAAVDRIRSVVEGLFPWVKRIGVTASGALGIRSAASRTELEGGGRPASGKGHFCVRLAFFPGVPGTTPPSLWFSNSPTRPYAWTAVAATIITGPIDTAAGTPVTINEGSAKVQIDG